MRQSFIVTIDVPETVSASEVASHLSDAHRMAVRSYHPTDPLSAVKEIEVFAAVPSSELPADMPRVMLHPAAAA